MVTAESLSPDTTVIRVTETSRAALTPVTRHEPGLAPRG